MAPTGLRDLGQVTSVRRAPQSSWRLVHLLLARARQGAGLTSSALPFPRQLGPPAIGGLPQARDPVLLRPWHAGSGSQPGTNTDSERENLGKFASSGPRPPWASLGTPILLGWGVDRVGGGWGRGRGASQPRCPFRSSSGPPVPPRSLRVWSTLASSRHIIPTPDGGEPCPGCRGWASKPENTDAGDPRAHDLWEPSSPLGPAALAGHRAHNTRSTQPSTGEPLACTCSVPGRLCAVRFIPTATKEPPAPAPLQHRRFGPGGSRGQATCPKCGAQARTSRAPRCLPE